MWEYIVLGEVPGTSVQVSFETWLLAVACLVAVSIIIWEIRRKKLRSFLLLRLTLLTLKFDEQALTRRHIQA